MRVDSFILLTFLSSRARAARKITMKSTKQNRESSREEEEEEEKKKKKKKKKKKRKRKKKKRRRRRDLTSWDVIVHDEDICFQHVLPRLRWDRREVFGQSEYGDESDD